MLNSASTCSSTSVRVQWPHHGAARALSAGSWHVMVRARQGRPNPTLGTGAFTRAGLASDARATLRASWTRVGSVPHSTCPVGHLGSSNAQHYNAWLHAHASCSSLGPGTAEVPAASAAEILFDRSHAGPWLRTVSRHAGSAPSFERTFCSRFAAQQRPTRASVAGGCWRHRLVFQLRAEAGSQNGMAIRQVPCAPERLLRRMARRGN